MEPKRSRWIAIGCWLAMSCVAAPASAGKACKAIFRNQTWEAWTEKCPAGLAQGRGRANGRAGAFYEGAFRKGLFHGQGRLELAATWVYVGQFRAGRMTGQGKLELPDGTRYEGGFLNDEFHGRGVENIGDGSGYRGGWHQGRMQGQGTFTLVDGTRYEGRFSQNRMVGRVTVIGPDGKRRTQTVPTDAPAWRVSDMSTGRMVDHILARADQVQIDRQPTSRAADPAQCAKLPWVALRGEVDELRRLLSSRCPPNQADADGRTGLHMAVLAGRRDVVDLLLEHGADPAAPDGSGQSAAQLAKQLGRRGLLRRLGGRQSAK